MSRLDRHAQPGRPAAFLTVSHCCLLAAFYDASSRSVFRSLVSFFGGLLFIPISINYRCTPSSSSRTCLLDRFSGPLVLSFQFLPPALTKPSPPNSILPMQPGLWPAALVHTDETFSSQYRLANATPSTSPHAPSFHPAPSFRPLSQLPNRTCSHLRTFMLWKALGKSNANFGSSLLISRAWADRYNGWEVLARGSFRGDGVFLLSLCGQNPSLHVNIDVSSIEQEFGSPLVPYHTRAITALMDRLTPPLSPTPLEVESIKKKLHSRAHSLPLGWHQGTGNARRLA